MFSAKRDEELTGAFLLGMVDDLLGIALLHNEAAIHEDHLISHIPGKGHLVGYDDHGGFLLGKAADDLQHLAGQLRIQCGGGLVKAENVRMQRQCAGNGHPLLLTAGELVGIVICPVGKPHLRQKIHTGGTDGFLAFACCPWPSAPGPASRFPAPCIGERD